MTNSNPPRIYLAHPVTGEYIGEAFADPNPLDPDNWLIPARAFVDAPPPSKVGFAVINTPDSDQTWSLVQDRRGIVYSKVDGKAREWQELGPLPDYLTAEVCPGPFYVWQEDRWQLDQEAEAKALSSQALAERDRLLAAAATRIAPLQDAVDLGDASPEEEIEMEAWKRYRVALNRIQRQPDFPKVVDWPASPVNRNQQ